MDKWIGVKWVCNIMYSSLTRFTATSEQILFKEMTIYMYLCSSGYVYTGLSHDNSNLMKVYNPL